MNGRLEEKKSKKHSRRKLLMCRELEELRLEKEKTESEARRKRKEKGGGR